MLKNKLVNSSNDVVNIKMIYFIQVLTLPILPMALFTIHHMILLTAYHQDVYKEAVIYNISSLFPRKVNCLLMAIK